MKACVICKKKKDRSEFNKKSKSPDGLQPACRECNRLRSRAYYEKNREKHLRVIRKNRAQYRAERKEFVRLVKQINPCPVCGETELCCIDFHHRSDKEAHIGQAADQGWSESRLRKELRKCVTLCSNCHRKLHAGLISEPKVKLKLPP